MEGPPTRFYNAMLYVQPRFFPSLQIAGGSCRVSMVSMPVKRRNPKAVRKLLTFRGWSNYQCGEELNRDVLTFTMSASCGMHSKQALRAKMDPNQLSKQQTCVKSHHSFSSSTS